MVVPAGLRLLARLAVVGETKARAKAVVEAKVGRAAQVPLQLPALGIALANAAP